MTRVLPLPAPARISTGPSVVSTASRCCGFSWSRKDNAEVAPESLIQFYRGIAAGGIARADFPIWRIQNETPTRGNALAGCEFWPQGARAFAFFPRSRTGQRTLYGGFFLGAGCARPTAGGAL